MIVKIDLSDKELAYIRTFKMQQKQRPLTKKEMAIPSVQIFVKLSEAVK